jgi:hypothetical protein
MRLGLAVAVLMVICHGVHAQRSSPIPILPDRFEVSVRTFFDFGPPFNYYELFLVTPANSGSVVRRITLTPPGYACTMPARVETASATVAATVSDLLSTNPCAIPEKKLHRVPKRCKRCLAFSGENVTLRVSCGNQTRVIRSDILDRDTFDPAAKKSPATSWTMQLLDRLTQAVGPGVLSIAAFAAFEDSATPARALESAIGEQLASGEYDPLFANAPDKPSAIYTSAANFVVPDVVEVKGSLLIKPEVVVLPKYPPLARAANVQGTVYFSVDVSYAGEPTNVLVTQGHPLLRGAVKDAVLQWKFPNGIPGEQLHAAIAFGLHCQKETK